MRTTLCLSLATAATLTFAAADAFACGGFFCDGAGPTAVNQAAERIIFAEHPDGNVTSVIQIMYDGPTDRFGWLLPVPGIPEVGLSSDAAFTALQNATNPQYNLTTRVEGECKVEDTQNNLADFGSAQNGDFSSNNTTGAPNEGGVVVLDRGSAGPYDYVVIQVDSAMGDKAQLALDWLTENNYQVTDVGPDLIAPYLDENYNLLAVRLQKTSDSGSVRPLKLTYEDDHAMIPIKLTAVAANEDMGVMTWVLGPSRAVPVNYKSLDLNDALIDWFTSASNYNSVVIAAANEASGQGFVTEYADATSTIGRVIFNEGDAAQWSSIESQDWTGDELNLIDTVVNSFMRFDNFGNGTPWDGMEDALRAAIPGLTAEQLEQIMFCGSSCAFPEGIPAGFETATFITAVDDFVVAPMRETQELIDDFSYVTRMYTTMSAHEMTLDPSFDFNPDLPEVSNIHTAERIIECHPSIYRWEAPWRVELPSGLVVRGEAGSGWPTQEMMPATLAVREVGTSGEGTVVRDNLETVRQQLEEANAKVPAPADMAKRDVGGGGACSTAAGTGNGLWLVGLLGLLGLRRRRR